MNKCKTCEKNCEGDYCFSHKPRRKMTKRTTSVLKDSIRKYHPDNRYNQMTGELVSDHDLQVIMFMDIWKKRPHLSEVSGNYLGMEPLSTYFHHILPKSKYPELRLVEENIILLTLDEHANVESDMYKYEEVNKRRELLITKYKNQISMEANETVGVANALVTFGDAMVALKAGKRVQRTGWNGKDLFIFRQVPSEVPAAIVPKMTSLPQSVKDEFQRRFNGPAMTDGMIKYSNQIAIVYPDNRIFGWSPSAADAVSEDWVILD